MVPRVLQLLPALGDGGVERSTVEMADHLAELGAPGLVASAGGDLVAELARSRTRHVTLPVGAKNPLTALGAAVRLARVIDEAAVDVLHARSRMPAWVALAARRLSRRRPAFVSTFHGVYGHRGALKRAYNAGMLRGPLVIANSGFIRDHLVSVYGVAPERIVVAPRGIDPARFDPAHHGDAARAALRAVLGVPADAAMLVLVGRLSRWKGHMTLVRALAALRTARPWRAVFVGGETSGALRGELTAAAGELGVAERIVFAGSRRDVPAILAAADLAFSVSTEPEAFGRAAVEAAAMARPVIAAAHGGSLETVLPGRTGWLVPPGDPVALAAAIDEALADPARAAALGAAGRDFVLAEFTTQRTVEREAAVYRRLTEPAR